MREFTLWLVGVWCVSMAHAVSVVDDRQVNVTITKAPMRIVTLMPSLAETVCALDACGRLVGTDNYADWPAQVKTLPKLGGLYDASVEAIVRLKPDLVLAGKSTRIVARLESLGIQVIALEPQTLNDVERSLHVIAQALHLSQPDAVADAVWSRAMRSVESAAQSLPAEMRGNTLYFEASTGGYAAGERSFIGGVISKLGLRNIIDQRLGAFPQINPEFVVRANPRWMVLAEPMAQSLSQRPGWRNMDAVKSHRLCKLTNAQADVLVRPGPRIGEAAQTLVNCLKKAATP